jgi:hypothetical protein
MSAQIPIVSADAGNPQALSDPNSPASIMKKAKESHSQSVADTKYDAKPPPREGEGYANYEPSTRKEIIAGFLVSSAFLLFLYSVAP